MPNPFDDLLPARSQTVTRHANPFDDILPSRTAPPSAVGAFGRSVARSAVPSVTAAGGAGAALTLGAPLIAASGPAAPLTALALGLGGGAVGGIGGAIAQRKALRTFAPQFERRMMAQSQRDVAAHPVAAIAGELAPQILTFRPSVRNLAKAGQAVKLVARGGKLTAEQAAQLANVAGGTAIGAGVEAGGQVARRERFSPGRIALAGAGGGLLNQPTRLGQRLGFRAITPEKTIVFGSHAEKVQTQFIDKFAPVAHLTQVAEQAIGRKVIPAENPYQAARLYAGVPGRINVRARELGQILKPLQGQTDDLSRVMVAERNAELTAQGRGLGRERHGNVPLPEGMPAGDLVEIAKRSSTARAFAKRVARLSAADRPFTIAEMELQLAGKPLAQQHEILQGMFEQVLQSRAGGRFAQRIKDFVPLSQSGLTTRFRLFKSKDIPEYLTVFRGIRQPETSTPLRPGDFITIDRNVAQRFAGTRGQIMAQRISTKDILGPLDLIPGSSQQAIWNQSKELIYAPGGQQPQIPHLPKISFEDFFNQARGQRRQPPTTTIASVPAAQIRLRSGQAAPVETLDQLTGRLGPERVTQLQGMARQVTDYNNRVLLADAVDAGIVSPDAAQAMQARNERYVPFETLETLADDLLEEGGVRFGRQSFQVAKQDVFKRLEGGAQLLEDPLAAQVNKIFKVTTLAERNRVGRTLLTLQRTNPGETQSFIQPLAKDARPPQGMSEFTVFEIGQPVKLAIPTPVADAMKGLTSEAVDFVTKFASLQSRALRSGATTFNVGFAVTNPIRDYQLAALVTRQAGVPFNPMIWARGLFDATLGRVQANSLFDEFERSLAAGSGYFQQQTGRNVGQAGLREIAPTRGQKAFRIAATVLNPAKWIQEIGNAGEQATRLAVFRQARRVGKSPADVAFLTRNSTIDFSRMGTSMKLANMWVPFINARLQGTINTFKAVKGNPLGASYVLTTMIATPALATLAWNIKKFPEIWQDIAQYEKDNNFIFIYGNARASDGRPTQVRKIPKGDVGRIVANPLEQALLFLQGREPQTADQLLMKIASDVSPISFEREGQFSGERLLGSVSPPALQAAEVLTSPTAVDRFSGFPVVPRRLQEVSPQLRRKPTTSATLTRLADTAIGRKLGVSPIQTEAAIGKATAGGGRLLLNLVDKLAFGQNKPGGIFGAAIGYRFAGARGGATEEAQIERAIAMRQRGLDARELRRQQASALLEQLRQHPNDPTQRDRLLRDAQRRDPQVIDKLREIATDEQNGVTTLDRILRTMTIVDRGRFIAEELQRIPTPQERRVFLEGLQRKKLLTPATLEQVRKQRSR